MKKQCYLRNSDSAQKWLKENGYKVIKTEPPYFSTYLMVQGRVAIPIPETFTIRPVQFDVYNTLDGFRKHLDGSDGEVTTEDVKALENFGKRLGEGAFPATVDLGDGKGFVCYGLSKREYIASQVLSALIQKGYYGDGILADYAVRYTDELLEKLREEPKEIKIPERKDPIFQTGE